jgi:hypothetical protein
MVERKRLEDLISWKKGREPTKVRARKHHPRSYQKILFREPDMAVIGLGHLKLILRFRA